MMGHTRADGWRPRRLRLLLFGALDQAWDFGEAGHHRSSRSCSAWRHHPAQILHHLPARHVGADLAKRNGQKRGVEALAGQDLAHKLSKASPLTVCPLPFAAAIFCCSGGNAGQDLGAGIALAVAPDDRHHVAGRRGSYGAGSPGTRSTRAISLAPGSELYRRSCGALRRRNRRGPARLRASRRQQANIDGNAPARSRPLARARSERCPHNRRRLPAKSRGRVVTAIGPRPAVTHRYR